MKAILFPITILNRSDVLQFTAIARPPSTCVYLTIIVPLLKIVQAEKLIVQGIVAVARELDFRSVCYWVLTNFNHFFVNVQPICIYSYVNTLWIFWRAFYLEMVGACGLASVGGHGRARCHWFERYDLPATKSITTWYSARETLPESLFPSSKSRFYSGCLCNLESTWAVMETEGFFFCCR